MAVALPWELWIGVLVDNEPSDAIPVIIEHISGPLILLYYSRQNRQPASLADCAFNWPMVPTSMCGTIGNKLTMSACADRSIRCVTELSG